MAEVTPRIREKAEIGLEFLLDRAIASGGRFTQEDAMAAQLFCRAIEAETNGGPYGVTTFIGADRDRILSAVAGATGNGGK